MRFSFLGLGNMGFPLAMNILRAGHELTIFTSKETTSLAFAGKGANVVEKVEDLADCDFLCTCLPMPEHVREACIGVKGLYAHMPKGSIHIDFSTVAPADANELAQAATGYGLGYVQATVSKTPEVAARGEAPFFVGGSDWAVEKAMPILALIGRPRNLKTLEAACGIKLISNLVGMSNVALVAEAMRIGRLSGIDGKELLELLLDTGAASLQMKIRGPWMEEGDFKARFSIDIAAKDLRLGCAMAKDLGYEPKIMLQTLEYLRAGHDMGIGDEDVCAMFKVTK